MDNESFNRQLDILHVEDDAVEAMNLQRIFNRLGVKHRLHVAGNGEDALSMLRNNPDLSPDLILLDLHMPRMGGLEFLQALRSDAALSPIAVYVLTSSDLPDDKEAAHLHQIKNYQVKPFTPAKYKEVILQLLSIWEQTDFPQRVQ